MTENYKKRSLILNGLNVLLINTNTQEEEEEKEKEEEDVQDEIPMSEDDANCSDLEADESDKQDIEDCSEDPEEDDSGNSYVSVAVGAGTFSDHPDIPGLAHLLEHTLFLGTHKFPKNGEFDKLVKNNEGSNDGQTGLDITTYTFDVQTKHFSYALEQFASMFTAPLFHKYRIKQEIEIVDAELTLRHRNEKMMHDYLLTQMTKDGHPMGRFTWGSATTLDTDPKKTKIDVYRELQEFFKAHYVADNMSLVVMSGLSLNRQEELVKKHFSALPRGTNEAGKYTGKCEKDEMPFDLQKFNKIYKVTAPAYDSTMYITWALPGNLTEQGETKVLRFICWLLNHEGPGCLGDALIKKGYATSTSVRDGNHDLSYSAVTYIRDIVSLTTLGLENASEVIEYFFKYVQDLKDLSSEEMEKLWKSLNSQEELSAMWSSPLSEIESVKELSIELQRKNDHRDNDSSDAAFSFQSVQAVLNLLSPDTMNITVFSPYFQPCDQNKYATWFKFYYSEETLPTDLLHRLKNISQNETKFQLPRKNPFLPSKFNVKSKKASSRISFKPKVPRKIDNTDCKWPYVLYYMDGSAYNSPTACLYFYLRNEVLSSTVQQSCISDIYVRALTLHLNDILYEADLGMMGCTIYNWHDGIVLQFRGFTDKLQLFVKEVIERIAKFEMKPSLFSVTVECVKTGYRNTLATPEALVEDMRQSHLNVRYWSAESKLRQIELITMDSFNKIKQTIQKSTTLECLIQGNLDSGESCDFAEFVVRTLCLTGCDDQECDSWCPIRMIPVGDFSISRLNHPGDDNMKIQNYYQIYDIDRSLTGKKVSPSETLMELLVKMMEEPCETFLRSRCALGYSVETTAVHDDPAHGLAITVHSRSSKFTAANVEHYIDLFIQEFLSDHIQCLAKETFKHFVDMTKNQLSESGLRKDSSRNWAEILKGRYNFKKMSEQIEQLERLSMKEFKHWVIDLLAEDSRYRRKLSIQVIGQEILGPV